MNKNLINKYTITSLFLLSLSMIAQENSNKNQNSSIKTYETFDNPIKRSGSPDSENPANILVTIQPHKENTSSKYTKYCTSGCTTVTCLCAAEITGNTLAGVYGGIGLVTLINLTQLICAIPLATAVCCPSSSSKNNTNSNS